MKTFVWQNGRPQAMKKYNDDLIMACAIGCWVKDIAYETSQRDSAYKKAFLNSMTKSTKQLNSAIPGMTAYKKVKQGKELEEAKKSVNDFLWLYKG